MAWKIGLALTMIVTCILFFYPVAEGQSVVVLCYHDVGDKSGSQWVVSKQKLEEQFKYLKENGYTPISLALYREACANNKVSLPAKPVLLTFDDGYASFYTTVYPLLKEYKYPAVLAVVTSWQELGAPADVGPVVNWQQMREMDQSGLITIASHSNDLHRKVKTGAAYKPITELVAGEDGKYESHEEYTNRIANDMSITQNVLEQKLGHKVDTYVWPYGAYNKVALDLAKAQGFKVFFTMGYGANSPSTDMLERGKRVAITSGMGTEEFAKTLNAETAKGSLRVAQLDLDIIYDDNPKQFEKNIDAAIDYFTRSNVTTVFLEAHADKKGNGNIEGVYFYTSVAPVKKDVFGYVTERLHAKNFRVYAWLSTLSGQWLIKDHPEDAVQASAPGRLGWYKRATPFSPQVRESLKMLVRDLAAYNNIDGIVFNDDLYFNDFEDMSPGARAAFKERFGREMTLAALQEPNVQSVWAEAKAKALNDLTLEMVAEMRRYRPEAASARNIYSAVVTEPEAKKRFAQDFREYLKFYDYTVIMAYPRMEKVPDADEWLIKLTQAALAEPKAKDKVIFKLQSFDWNTRKWVNRKELERQVALMRNYGAMHIGYYPVNIINSDTELLPF
ncbi:MAG: Poly-beta,6-N-acetyl-D-glucosamine N-deacetylase PgaB [Firmicutes bacterium]|nr:Poly-beta,6-N-acetyl-D-glucosamine N-deacetylase PgaB [Bacillota bacterium]